MKNLPYLFLVFFLSQNVSADKHDLEFNKKLVSEFFKEVIFDGNSKAIDKYVGDKYIQHNPYVGDGKESLRAFVDSFPPKTKDAKPSGEIVRVIAEKDLVVLHIKMPTRAMVDIFRVENNKIVEHWDVSQSIPEKSANNNTMF